MASKSTKSRGVGGLGRAGIGGLGRAGIGGGRRQVQVQLEGTIGPLSGKGPLQKVKLSGTMSTVPPKPVTKSKTR